MTETKYHNGYITHTCHELRAGPFWFVHKVMNEKINWRKRMFRLTLIGDRWHRSIRLFLPW